MIDNNILAATCSVTCGDVIGTGFLIRPDRVLTARHCVIKALEANDSIELLFSRIALDNSERRVTASVVADSTEHDACILAIEPIPNRAPIPISDVPPREGIPFRAFGFPVSKGAIGHRLNGNVEQVLSKPKAKLDLDLSVDPSVALDSYKGMSGAPVLVNGRCVGMLRFRADRSVAAISIGALSGVLTQYEIPISMGSEQETQRPHLAERSAFLLQFEESLVNGGGRYFFLEGAHGIGKTTFCQYFTPTNQQLLHVGTYCVLEPTGESNTLVRSQPEVLYDWFMTSISVLLSGKAARYERMTYLQMTQEISSLLNALDAHCAQQQCIGVLIIDGLNEVNSADSKLLPYFVGLLPRTLPKRIAIVLSSPSYAGAAAVLNDRVSAHNVRTVPQLSETASIAYCGKKLIGAHASNYEFIRHLCEKASGHPLYLNYLIRHANTVDDVSLVEFPTLDGPIEQYYERVWQTFTADDNSIHLLSILARLREDLSFDQFVNVLTTTEQAVFVPTITRIQHLLQYPNHTTIYHASFTDYIVGKTHLLEPVIHARLLEYCLSANTVYSIRNRLYHALRCTPDNQSIAMELCTQEWVDDCVLHSASPDVLLSDTESVVEAAFRAGEPVNAIRLLLLHQRVTFRYDTLFAQSARLVAEALIVLGRPREALTHIIRHGVLILNINDALETAHFFIKHEYFDEALRVLGMIRRRCISFYSTHESTVPQFIGVTLAHIQTVLLGRLAGNGNHFREVHKIIDQARGALTASIAEVPLRESMIKQIITFQSGYFLAFCDTYVDSATQYKIARIPKKNHLHMIVDLFLHHIQMVEDYGMSKQRKSFDAIFTDIEALLRSKVKVDDRAIPLFIDALIRLGATANLIVKIAAGRSLDRPQEVTLRGPNGVDAEIHAVLRNGMTWRARGFLGKEANYPILPGYARQTWLSSLERSFDYVFYCEGRARLAKANGNKELLREVDEKFQREFFATMRFTLAERIMWDRSYALPEASVPYLYECAVELIFDCFPERLLSFLEFLHGRCSDQLGLYTEGFRECLFRVIGHVSRHELAVAVKVKLVSLLDALRMHILAGVENRHELVPELLRLIRLYGGVGAKEIADGIYRDVLRFSMGPSWYKESQFGLMTTALSELTVEDGYYDRLPSIAGKLERASGEMTFQRYVRQHKSNLIGVLARQGLLRAACGYFRAQSCGEIPRLFTEWETGKIDVPRPRRGNRFPGGAIDEQAAILEIVRESRIIDWRLRWSLLEVFQFGDSRYTEQYAKEFASLFAEAAGQLDVRENLLRRFNAVLVEDLETHEKAGFINAFYDALQPEYRVHFKSLLTTYGSSGPTEAFAQPESTTPISQKPDSKKGFEPDLYAPGLFGKQDSISTAEGELDRARTQLQLGNTDAAKQLLVNALSTLQAGGWTIWEGPAECSREAERLLKATCTEASDLTAQYALLVAGERYAASWVIADHIITQVGSLLSGMDRQLVLDQVLEHTRLMIGDSAVEEESYRFLGDVLSPDPSLEVFRFIIWLVDHPEWIRRERAAEVLLWLVELDGGYIDLAIDLAFEKSVGFGADVLCGILDILSLETPISVWERVRQRVDFQKISQLPHTGRYATLYFITKRARDAGSATARSELIRIASLIRDGSIELDDSKGIYLPRWADCVADRWERLEGMGIRTLELRDAIAAQLVTVCEPFRIEDVYGLESAVSASFSAPVHMHLNRWEAKVHFALNTALFPYVSARNIERTAGVLRVFSPTAPCRYRTVEFVPPIEWNLPITNYSTLIGNEEYYYLHIHRIHQTAQGQVNELKVLAVIVPISLRRRGLFLPELQATFHSSEYLSNPAESLPHETCRPVIPETIFFGPFTPAEILPQFGEFVNNRPEDIRRISWKRGRAKETEHYGTPYDEGCALAVRKSAIILPKERKLAWIIMLDGKVQAMIDAENNELF